MALNLEICDWVNAKQGSAPREAAIAVVKLISQRDPQTSELAIALLDNLVKNCGYPFHLQISRKEFLNELVKRFPESPPLRYNRVQRLVLAQIEEWYQTICKTSKYKEDFTYIRDMHRLLSNKGYIFPEVKVEDAAVLNPSDNLKSLEELQKEEAVVHSAKLQELIRRGRPQDLQEANKLMKIMAGFKNDNVVENKKQLSSDVSRLKRKVEILDEMLVTVESSSGIVEDSNEAAIELYASIKSSQPSITKIIEEEQTEGGSEDHVQTLLTLNDNINVVMNKFQLLRKGNVSEAANLKISSLGSNGASAANDLNLIDFDDDAPISNDAKDDQGFNDLLNDLSSLSFSGNTSNTGNLYGRGGSISLGLQQPKPTPPLPNSNTLDLLGDLNSPSPQLQSNQSTAPIASPAASLDPFGLSFPSSTPSAITTPQAVTPNTSLINESNNLKIEVSTLESTGTGFKGEALFSNKTFMNNFQNFKFLLAVPKSCTLKLDTQSSNLLTAGSNRGVSQRFSIENPNSKPLKIKWKVEYSSNGQVFEETGVSTL